MRPPPPAPVPDSPGSAPAASPGAGRAGRARWTLAAWLAIGVLVAFHPALRHGWQRPLENYPDTRLMTFVLEHGHRCLASGASWDCLWRPPYFHPFAESGALTEIQLGILPFYSPWRWSGAGPFPAALLAQLLQSIAVFALAVRLFRQGLAATPGEAGFGAFLVAFGSPKMAQVYHLQLFAQVPLYLALLLAQRWLDRDAGSARPLRGGLLLGLLAALQFYSCVYVAALAALLLAASAPGLLLFAPERAALGQRLRRGALTGALALAVALGLAWPAAGRYLTTADQVVRPAADNLSELLPTPAALLNPGDRSLLGRPLAEWTGLPARPYAWEHSLGVGLAVTLLFLLGAGAALRTAWLRVLVLGAALAWLLVLRWPGGFSAWALLLDQIPALGFLRAVSRLQLLVLPVIAATAILGLRRVGRRWGRVAAAALVALAAAEQARDWGLQEPASAPTAAAVAAALPADCPAFFLSTTGERQPPRSVHLTAMWAALDSGVPTLNGYSGYRPAGWRLGAAHEARAGEGDLGVRLAEWTRTSGLDGGICWLRADESAGVLTVERLGTARPAP